MLQKERTPSSAGRLGRLPDLRKKLENLDLSEPLHAAERNKGALKVDAAVLNDCDMRYLALATMDRIMTAMGLGNGAPLNEVIAWTEDLVRQMCPAARGDDASYIAQWVVTGCLMNRSEGYRDYQIRRWHPSEGWTWHRFKLVVRQVDGDNDPLVLTEQGISLLLDQLNLEPMDLQAAYELLLKTLLDRGLFDEAITQARNASKISIQIQDDLRKRLRRLRHDAQHDYDEALGSVLVAARTHIEAALRRETDTRALVADKLDRLQDDEQRDKLGRLEHILDETLLRHKKLLHQLMTAGQDYQDMMAAMRFVHRSGRLPDPESMLVALGARDIAAAAVTAEALAVPLMPARPRRLFSLKNALSVLFAEPPPEAENGILDRQEEEVESAIIDWPFPEPLVDAAQRFTQIEIAAGTTTLEDLITLAEKRHGRIFAFAVYVHGLVGLDPSYHATVLAAARLLPDAFRASFVRCRNVAYAPLAPGEAPPPLPIENEGGSSAA